MPIRPVRIDGHPTSVSLEEEFFDALKEIATERHLTLGELITLVGADRSSGGLSSALRVFVLDHYRSSTHHVGPVIR